MTDPVMTTNEELIRLCDRVLRSFLARDGNGEGDVTAIARALKERLSAPPVTREEIARVIYDAFPFPDPMRRAGSDDCFTWDKAPAHAREVTLKRADAILSLFQTRGAAPVAKEEIAQWYIERHGLTELQTEAYQERAYRLAEQFADDYIAFSHRGAAVTSPATKEIAKAIDQYANEKCQDAGTRGRLYRHAGPLAEYLQATLFTQRTAPALTEAHELLNRVANLLHNLRTMGCGHFTAHRRTLANAIDELLPRLTQRAPEGVK